MNRWCCILRALGLFRRPACVGWEAVGKGAPGLHDKVVRVVMVGKGAPAVIASRTEGLPQGPWRLPKKAIQ